MHFTTFLPIVLSITGSLASPTLVDIQPSSTTPVRVPLEGIPGVFVQSVVDEAEIDESFTNIDGNAKDHLQKRSHLHCYHNDLSPSAQGAYASDCRKLIDSLRVSDGSFFIAPLQGKLFTTKKKLCEIYVSNQSSCQINHIYHTMLAGYALSTFEACPNPWNRAGFGMLGDPRNRVGYSIYPHVSGTPPQPSPSCSRHL